MKWLLVALIAGVSADTITTELALQYPGLHESNPIAQSRAFRITATVAVPLTIWHITKPLDKKWRFILIGAVIAFNGYTAHRNWGLYQKHRLH